MRLKDLLKVDGILNPTKNQCNIIFVKIIYRLQYDTTSFFKQCQNILKLLNNHTASWPFKKPVNPEEVPDYADLIKNPMGCISIIII